MKKYDDIIKKINEIIEYSRRKKSQLTKEDVLNYNKIFTKILFEDIAIECASELQSLLDTEMVFHLLMNDPNVGQKNNDLEVECKNSLKQNNEYTNDYVRMLEILNNAIGKTPLELSEHSGYIICRDELNEFLNISRKLNIGPGLTMNSAKSDDARALFWKNSKLKAKKEQCLRIRNYIPEQKNIDNNMEALDKLTDRNTWLVRLSLLGISKKLSLEMVVELKRVLTEDEYNNLLTVLLEHDIFKANEIDIIKNTEYNDDDYVNDMDKLVAFFVGLGPSLNIDTLKYLILSIGKYNFDYLIEELYKIGIIKQDE